MGYGSTGVPKVRHKPELSVPGPEKTYLGDIVALDADGREDLFKSFSGPFEIIPLDLWERTVFVLPQIEKVDLSIRIRPIIP